MKYRFIDNNSNELIVFFNGWGMDGNLLNHFDNEDKDILIFFDYHNDTVLPTVNLKKYESTYIIAWSMGVFIANQLADKLNQNITKSIAICGSPYPVHNEYGIPVKIFDLTCKGLRLAGTDKFFQQMFAGSDNSLFNRPQRELFEQIDELNNLKDVSIDANMNNFKWDVALVGVKDRIFPARNLVSYWNDKTKLVQEEMPHYPFNLYDSWSKILSL